MQVGLGCGILMETVLPHGCLNNCFSSNTGEKDEARGQPNANRITGQVFVRVPSVGSAVRLELCCFLADFPESFSGWFQFAGSNHLEGGKNLCSTSATSQFLLSPEAYKNSNKQSGSSKRGEGIGKGKTQVETQESLSTAGQMWWPKTDSWGTPPSIRAKRDILFRGCLLVLLSYYSTKTKAEKAATLTAL